MKLEYSTLLSPNSVSLSAGIKGKSIHLRKPTLRQIDLEITFKEFGFYESFLRMTPTEYYSLTEEKAKKWESMPNEEKNKISMFSILQNDEIVQFTYLKIFEFFFEEDVTFYDGVFVFIPKGCKENIVENALGVIGEPNFLNLLDVIAQTCGINKKEEHLKFKNNTARKLYEKMKKAREEEEKRQAEKNAKNLSLANLISKVSNRHPTISPLNVWDLTVYQLIDSFNCCCVNEGFDINKTRVAVWGDEKNVFDEKAWYKSYFDE